MEDVMIEQDVGRRTKSSSNRWNPNVPFHCTQEEFLEHIHSIEAGEFMTLEEFKSRHEAWKKEYLASKLK